MEKSVLADSFLGCLIYKSRSIVGTLFVLEVYLFVLNVRIRLIRMYRVRLNFN